MSDYKALCAKVCVIMVITGIIRFLIPESKIKKTADIFIAMIVVFSLVSPFLNLKNTSDFKIKLDELQDFSNSENSQYNYAIESYYENFLKENNVKYNYVKAKTNLDEEGYIEIEQIEIKLEDNSQKQYTENLIYEKSEMPCESVIIE